MIINDIVRSWTCIQHTDSEIFKRYLFKDTFIFYVFVAWLIYFQEQSHYTSEMFDCQPKKNICHVWNGSIIKRLIVTFTLILNHWTFFSRTCIEKKRFFWMQKAQCKCCFKISTKIYYEDNILCRKNKIMNRKSETHSSKILLKCLHAGNYLPKCNSRWTLRPLA